MQIILAIEVCMEGVRQISNPTWQIPDGYPPLTGSRRVHRHRYAGALAMSFG